METIKLENLQALRGYAVVNDLRCAYRLVDGVINDVLMADVDEMLAFYREAESLGVGDFDLYLMRHPGIRNSLRLMAFNAVRRLSNNSCSVCADEKLCKAIKDISVLL